MYAVFFVCKQRKCVCLYSENLTRHTSRETTCTVTAHVPNSVLLGIFGPKQGSYIRSTVILSPEHPQYRLCSYTDVYVSLPSLPPSADNWSVKAKRRNTTGTGRMKHLLSVQRRFRNGFREGTQAKSQKRRAQKTES